jgi:SAM-dependent methyltransferase
MGVSRSASKPLGEASLLTRPTVLQRLVRFQARLCEAIDTLLPPEFVVDGNTHFQREFAPPYIRSGMIIYDIGSGKNPLISRECKVGLNLKVHGLDLDSDALASTPEGIFDGVICADITQFRGSGQADLVICQSVLEHVKDIGGAFAGINSVLKRGGIALLFVPCRHALFAQLNLVIPQALKRWLLFALFAHKKETSGFPAYYRGCTPGEMRGLAGPHGFRVLQVQPYFMSSYFSFLLPLYIAWRLWLLTLRLVKGEQAAETFSVALMKV